VTPELTELVARIPAMLGDGRRRLLGITGAPGAGKSTLAADVAAACDGVVVPMDGFHRSNEALRQLGRLERKGAPDTFDADGYVALLRRLHSGGMVLRAPAFDRVAEAVMPDAIAVPPAALVITEGNYLLQDASPWDQVPALLDEVWFVEADEPLRVERLIARFVANGWDEDAARERVERGSDATNAALVARTRHRADLIVHLD
jgi:pantothenate kinase